MIELLAIKLTVQLAGSKLASSEKLTVLTFFFHWIAF